MNKPSNQGDDIGPDAPGASAASRIFQNGLDAYKQEE
jgi:hypothetical protein